jgi:hypothetical protein
VKNKFDFVAAYVIPEDVCFILPEKKVRGMWSVGLYPKLESSKYHEYNEAWHLLRGEAPDSVAWIEACAEEYIPAGKLCRCKVPPFPAAEAAFVSRTSRGAEAPLFHGLSSFAILSAVFWTALGGTGSTVLSASIAGNKLLVELRGADRAPKAVMG